MKRVNTNHRASPWTPMSQVLPGGAPSSLPFPVQKSQAMYCRRCGQLLLPYTMDEDGHEIYTLEEEMALGVCHKCYPAAVEELQRRLAEAAAKAAEAAQPTMEEKKLADEKYEQTIKKYMEDIGKRNGPDTSTNL